jgi:hypothetical protein
MIIINKSPSDVMSHKKFINIIYLPINSTSNKMTYFLGDIAKSAE